MTMAGACSVFAPSEKCRVTEFPLPKRRRTIRWTRAAGTCFAIFTLEKPVTSFAQSIKGALANKDLTGNLGGGILRRFKVIFDYPNRRMIVEPNSHFTESFESDMSGMVLIAEGAKLDVPTVFYVTQDSRHPTLDCASEILLRRLMANPRLH